MREEYKGYELVAEYSHSNNDYIFYSIQRLNDGYELICEFGQENLNTTIGTIDKLKDVVDDYLTPQTKQMSFPPIMWDTNRELFVVKSKEEESSQ